VEQVLELGFGEAGQLRRLRGDQVDAQDDVPQESARVAVFDGPLVDELVDLADVVQQGRRHQQVAVHPGVLL
jgi:hypothetical protein